MPVPLASQRHENRDQRHEKYLLSTISPSESPSHTSAFIGSALAAGLPSHAERRDARRPCRSISAATSSKRCGRRGTISALNAGCIWFAIESGASCARCACAAALICLRNCNCSAPRMVSVLLLPPLGEGWDGGQRKWPGKCCSIRGWPWQDRADAGLDDRCKNPHPNLPPKAGRRKTGC